MNRSATSALASVAFLVCLAGSAAAADSMSVPAEFVSYVSPPGVVDHFLRPSAIHVDRANGEMLVADPGKNRIVIFDTAGHYRFEFGLDEHAAMPVDLTVDSRGFIYVVGSTQQGRRLLRFDFDGLFLGEVELPHLMSGQAVEVDNVDVDNDDNLVLLDRNGLRISVCEDDGTLIHSFDLAAKFSTTERHEIVLGSLTVADDRIYVPFSSFGTVFVYSLTGEQVASYGYMGTTPGQLAFPVAVAVTDGLVAVLDKHRFNVVCYDADGHFRGEFGGKGISPGWFYHPTLLGAGPDSKVYIGQIFQNKVQICRIPDFITINGRPSAVSDPSQGS